MPTQILFQRSASWTTGFVGQVSITPDMALDGWTLAFDGAFTIDSIWGAEIVSVTAGRYLLRGQSWNSTAPAGGTIGFGFSASGPGAIADPTGFALGGADGLPLVPPPPPGPPSLSVGDVAVLEGAGFATFEVKLSAAATGPVTVKFATANGSAKAGLDFSALSGGLTFAAGETVKRVSVALVNDRSHESTESFSLKLSAATGATIADGTGVATIRDDDVARISVSDASVIEGNSGNTALAFKVTLAEAMTSTVHVTYATSGGTAESGIDFVARSGTVTFSAGQTEKIVYVTAIGDRAVEMDETMVLTLSAPYRGVIVDGTGIGTIVNNDKPRIAIADATVTEGDPGAPGLVGVLSTRGCDIVDSTGEAVKIAAVNWFGLEGTTFAPHGLHVRNWRDMMDQMAETGFNAIRLPFSAEAVLRGGTPNGIDFALNPDLAGLTPLQIMDRIIDYAGEIGLRIILDHHRSAAGAGPNGNGLWFDGGYTQAQWVGMWEMLAQRYAGDPTVIGADLSNEPHGASWGAWASAAELAGNAALAKNPDWLIFVEGVAEYANTYYWWGGNLMGAADRPVTLNVPNKLVYSAHDYPNSIHPQSFFQGPDFAAKLPDLFEKMWGYLWEGGTAPVFIGEFGTRLVDPKDRAWLDKIVDYMGGDIDADGDKDIAGPGISYAWWSWNPNSGDTGGILADDWTTVLTEKVAAIQEILPEPAEATRKASFTVTLSDPVSSAVTVGWRTAPGTADAASDYMHASGVLTFAPGQTRQVIEVEIRADEVAERAETFRLELFNAQNASFADALGIGRISDDDWVM
ncbi:cellulase family glycosylhydrolase [Roseomonas stagni]|uniref:cellulase n=1 Tax=Falsiroseomonas algicola TaxID=2716930 RepID=A0A6M1LGU7_9PROT|nr:Calx-beta domain-containing protein [Falsiroseomonas algicola]NGM19322.1 cellulase family glycosylhydrolase [Falsiroseomonas algicola]